MLALARRLAVSILLSLLWAGFVWLWYRVYRNIRFADLLFSLAYLVTVGILYSVVITFWILFNLRLYRSKPRRMKAKYVPALATRDFLGRPVVEAVSRHLEQEIVVDLAGGCKRYGPATAAFAEDLLKAAAAVRQTSEAAEPPSVEEPA